MGVFYHFEVEVRSLEDQIALEENNIDLLKADPEVTARLSDAEIEGLFDLGYHMAQVDTIFRRVFGRA